MKIQIKNNEWAKVLTEGHFPLGKDIEVVEMTQEDLNQFILDNRQPVPYDVLRRKDYIANYSDGDVKDIIMKQFNYMRMNGVDLIQEADDWVGSCLATKAKFPKGEENAK